MTLVPFEDRCRYTRQQARQLIDQAKRAQIAKAHQRDPGAYCSGCHGERDNYTPGCRKCMDRTAHRRRRLKHGQPCHGGCGRTVSTEPSYKHGYAKKPTGYCLACFHIARRAA